MNRITGINSLIRICIKRTSEQNEQANLPIPMHWFSCIPFFPCPPATPPSVGSLLLSQTLVFLLRWNNTVVLRGTLHIRTYVQTASLPSSKSKPSKHLFFFQFPQDSPTVNFSSSVVALVLKMAVNMAQIKSPSGILKIVALVSNNILLLL